MAHLPNLDKFAYSDCPVFGAAYEKPLRALTKAAADPDPAKDAVHEASAFFSAYAAWRSSEEATTKCAEAVPPDDATDEERGWFHTLFTVLTRAPACMDKEWLLLAAVDHNLLAAAQVLLLADEFSAQGTAPVEGDEQRRTVNKQSSSNAQLQALVSSLGAFMGRFRILKDVHKSATSKAFNVTDAKSEKAPNAVLKSMMDEQQYHRELDARKVKKSADGTEETLNPEYVVGIVTTSDELGAEAFAKAAPPLGLYPYGIIMEAGERNLQVVSFFYLIILFLNLYPHNPSIAHSL